MTAPVFPRGDDADALHVLGVSSQELMGAIAAECAAEDLVAAPAGRLRPYGRFRPDEEDPAQRRFLLAPPKGRWTTVFMSVPDWDHSWLPRLLARLPCRAAYLMLHDGDVATLHLYEGGTQRAALVTSPSHFDLEDLPRDPGLRAALEDFAGRALTDAEVEAACFPPGRLDVDGRLACERLASLLDLPDHGLDTYARALGADGLEPAGPFAGWAHACFADAELLVMRDLADAGDEDGEDEPPRDDPPTPTPHPGSPVVPFRPRRP